VISLGLQKWFSRFSWRNLFEKFRRRKEEAAEPAPRFGQPEMIETKPKASNFPFADEKPAVVDDLPASKPASTKPPKPVASPTSFSLPQLELTPVPEILRHLTNRVRADLVQLADRNGVPLAYCKNAPSQPLYRDDLEMIAKLAAGQIASGHYLAENIGEAGLLNSIFQEGERRNVFISQISAEFILIALVDKSVVIGLVRIHADEALASLRKILAE